MRFLQKLTSLEYSSVCFPGVIKRYTTTSGKFSFKSVMDASKNKITFFANGHDATDYFNETFCSNVSQGVGIKNFIKKYPDAVYTTARISGDDLMLFQFPSHVSRVSKGMEKLAPVSWKKYCDTVATDAPLKLREWFRETSYMAAEKLTNDVLNAIDNPQENEHTGLDIRLTVLARAADEIGLPPMELNIKEISPNLEHPSTYFHLYAIAEPMPVRDLNETISVVLRKDVINRGENPDVKDANFVRKRQILVDCQGKCEETLMAETGTTPSVITKNIQTNGYLPDSWKSTIITEGSSSNFFAVYRVGDKKNSFILRTAGLDKVLGGTIRELLLENYTDNSSDESDSDSIHLTVCTEPPTIDEIDEWVGYFVASTSRLALPISEVFLPVDCRSTIKIDKIVECNKDRSWPASQLEKDESINTASTAVVYCFDPQSQVMQKIVKETKMQILAHSETLKTQ